MGVSPEAIGNIFRLHRGYELTEKDRTPGDVPVFGAADIAGWHNVVKIPGPNVITGRKGTIGKVNYYADGCWPLDTTLYVEDFKSNEALYVFYLLKYFFLMNDFNGKDQTSVPGINRNHLHKKEVPYTNDLSEQRRISTCLYRFEQLIQLNDRQAAELFHHIAFLYDYWFTQFDFPDENGNPYRQAGGKMVHNTELDRDIPDGWIVSSLNDTKLFDVIKTGIAKFDGTKRYLATADVNNTDIDKGSLIEYETRESRANMQPALLSVWFAKMKEARKHLFISSTASDFVERTILSTGFSGLQCSENSFEYVASYISNPLFEKWKDQISHGATQKAVNGDDLSKILIVEPPDDVLKIFHEKTKDIYQMLNNMQAENERLAQLQDYLLPLLMSGQVIVNTENEND